MGQYSRFRRNLLDLGALNRALSIDTHLSLRGLGQAIRDYEQADEKTQEIVFEFCFWSRIVVRSFFAHMEGLSYFMRRTAAQPAHAAMLQLTTKQRAVLLERRYDKTHDQITDVLMPNKVGDNLKYAFRYYPKIFKVDFTLDTNSPTWKALIKILVRARNDMTHGGTFDDFYAPEAAQTLKSCFVWFIGSMVHMLRACYEQVGVDAPEIDTGIIQEHEFDAATFQQVTMDKEVFSHEVAKFQGRSFLVFRRSMSLLWQETSQAIEYFNLQHKHFGLDSPLTQFALRNFFRTLINYAESATYVFRLYIEHAEARGEISTTELERVSLAYKDPFDRLVATFSLFSAKFGDGSAFEAAAEHWSAVRTVLGYRNRLTHPLKTRNLEYTKPAILTTIVNCLGWLADVLGNITFDAEKIIEQGIGSGSIIPSGAEE